MSQAPTADKRQSSHAHWGYSKPDEWAKLYPVGSRQSPINILIDNYDQLIQSTCCAGSTNGNSTHSGHHKSHHHHHSHHNHNHHHEHVISERVASLHLDSSRSQPKPRVVVEQARTHLDSVGDEVHVRSSSTCSSTGSALSASGSSCPPSPAHNYDSDQDSAFANGVAEGQQQQQQLQVQKTRYCTSNHKMFLGYPRYLSFMQLCNTGHSWQVTLPAELAAHTLLTGPPFGEREYRLAQLHCHWGEDCERGSEHLINGRAFAAEIHFVHWNCTEYESMQEAAKHKHGLAVLGVMVQALEGEQHRNKHLDKIANALQGVETPGSSVDVSSRLDLKKLFPANRWNYVSYEGSLTTPPLSEVVDWVVFLEPIQCSTAQIEQFRRLKCPSERGHEAQDQMIKNHRPVQPHNGRLVTIWTHH